MSTNNNSINGPQSILLRTNVAISILSATATGCLKKKKNACQFVFPRKIFFSAIFYFHFRENPRFRDEFQALEENDAGEVRGGGGCLGAALGPQWCPAPGRGLGATPPQAEGFFSMSSHKKTEFWSMKIRYLQVSKLYV